MERVYHRFAGRVNGWGEEESGPCSAEERSSGASGGPGRSSWRGSPMNLDSLAIERLWCLRDSAQPVNAAWTLPCATPHARCCRDPQPRIQAANDLGVRISQPVASITLASARATLRRIAREAARLTAWTSSDALPGPAVGGLHGDHRFRRRTHAPAPGPGCFLAPAGPFRMLDLPPTAVVSP